MSASLQAVPNVPQYSPVKIPASKLPPYDEQKDNPWDKQMAYLLRRGWSFEGDPTNPQSLWFDPTKPTTTETRKEKFSVMGTNPDNPRGDKIMVRQFDRTVVYPAAAPVSRGEAVQIQLLRDAKLEGEAKAAPAEGKK